MNTDFSAKIERRKKKAEADLKKIVEKCEADLKKIVENAKAEEKEKTTGGDDRVNENCVVSVTRHACEKCGCTFATKEGVKHHQKTAKKCRLIVERNANGVPPAARLEKFVEKADKKAEEKEKVAGPEAALADIWTPPFKKCDILQPELVFEKTKTLDEMKALAVKNDCRIIIKNGDNGKWYLKGKGKPIEYLKSKIDKRLGKSPRDGVCCYLRL